MWSSASRIESARAAPSRTAPLLLLLLALAGCATTRGPASTTSASPAWETRRDALLALPAWQAEGRIAVNAGKEGGSGAFTWKQVDDALDFRFRGPVGVGGFRIDGDGESLHLKTTAGDERDLTDPERDLRERYGWSVPLNSMRYWMLGVPDPADEAAETLDDANELILLQQRGWTIEYGAYGTAAGTSLPRKVTMEGDGVRVRLIVERWELGE
jgi:outer membrane lipoprotein LolB